MTSGHGSSCRRLRGAAALAGGLALAGCASVAPEAPRQAVGLFRIDGRNGPAVAPGPRAAWYAARQPRYFEIGLAGWRAERVGGHRWLSAWLERLSHRRRTGDPAPVGVIAAHASLPLPSIVEVTNLRTGATLKVRVENRAELAGQLISLNASAAAKLGTTPDRPLLVRVRYSAPVVVYQERPALRLTLPRRTAPGLRFGAPVVLAAAKEAAAPIASVSRAPPLADVTPAKRPTAIAASFGLAPSPAGGDVQAGAFADPANARRAAAALAIAGQVRIETLVGRTRTLYLVVVSDPPDRGGATALRARVVQLGFQDAVVRRD